PGVPWNRSVRPCPRATGFDIFRGWHNREAPAALTRQSRIRSLPEVAPMLIVMKQGAAPEEVQRVVDVIEAMGYGARPIPGRQRTAVGLIGNDGKVDSSRLESLPGVLQVIHVTQPYKQVSREWRPEPTVIELTNGTVIGGKDIVLMAGPCAV